LQLQLQNSSALSIEVNLEAWSYTSTFELKQTWLFNFGDIILNQLISRLITTTLLGAL